MILNNNSFSWLKDRIYQLTLQLGTKDHSFRELKFLENFLIQHQNNITRLSFIFVFSFSTLLAMLQAVNHLQILELKIQFCHFGYDKMEAWTCINKMKNLHTLEIHWMDEEEQLALTIKALLHLRSLTFYTESESLDNLSLLNALSENTSLKELTLHRTWLTYDQLSMILQQKKNKFCLTAAAT